jgi:hypothetical protein
MRAGCLGSRARGEGIEIKLSNYPGLVSEVSNSDSALTAGPLRIPSSQ